jgi:serine/threonine-protein kinase RsbW
MARATGGRCIIEVLDTGHTARAVPVTAEPVPPTAEHGRGLQIIDAVVDNLRLSGNMRDGTTVHFEKALDWEPGAAGQQLVGGAG